MWLIKMVLNERIDLHLIISFLVIRLVILFFIKFMFLSVLYKQNSFIAALNFYLAIKGPIGFLVFGIICLN